MKEEILKFLEWTYHNGIQDIFELVDEPEKVVDRYMKENE
jgi:hypothetical protein